MTTALLVLLASVPAARAALPNPYATERLALFATLANHRPVDGLDYFDGDGLVSAGLRYSRPEGFYVATQALAGNGDGVLLPGVRVTTLETAAGWLFHAGRHGVSIELQDYRQSLGGPFDDIDYRGAAFHYRFGQFRLEAGYEADRPMYYLPAGRFFDYNTRRLAVGWHLPLSRISSLRFDLGSKEIDRIDLRYEHAGVHLDWRWQGFAWSLGYTAASNDIEAFYSPAADRSVLAFSVSRQFEFR